MRTLLLSSLIVLAISGSAMAQYARGSVGNGGRMPETMSPGALAPPATDIPSYSSPPLTSYGAAYPRTEPYAGTGMPSQGASEGLSPNAVD
jgi:hypothetical protein